MVGAAMVVPRVPVSDLERAKDFYGGTLGLTILWETPVSVRFRCGDSSELSTFKRPGLAAEHTLAHFEVTDIEAAVRDLEAKGVAFIDYTEGPLVTDEPHRATRSRARRVVPRLGREHPRSPAGVAP